MSEVKETAGLASKKCSPCSGETKPFSEKQIEEYSQQVEQWAYRGGSITRDFKFENYYQTTAFVNAVAWIAHQEDHHPDIEFGYNQCRVAWRTHKIDGLSENDFICAAKVDRLFPE